MDRRKQRTRQAIVQAFNELVVEGEKAPIRVADIVARADVGRSTFYDHFASAQAVFLAAFSYPLSLLADALAGAGEGAPLNNLLDHLWENRDRARALFSGRSRDQISSLLADLLRERQPELEEIKRLQLSEMALGLIRLWLLGRLGVSREVLARQLVDGGRGISSPAAPRELSSPAVKDSNGGWNPPTGGLRKG